LPRELIDRSLFVASGYSLLYLFQTTTFHRNVQENSLIVNRFGLHLDVILVNPFFRPAFALPVMAHVQQIQGYLRSLLAFDLFKLANDRPAEVAP
jgi:hypothetical protein